MHLAAGYDSTLVKCLKAAQVVGTTGQRALGVAPRASGTSAGKSAKPFGKQPGGNPKLERGLKLERFTAVRPLKPFYVIRAMTTG